MRRLSLSSTALTNEALMCSSVMVPVPWADGFYGEKLLTPEKEVSSSFTHISGVVTAGCGHSLRHVRWIAGSSSGRLAVANVSSSGGRRVRWELLLLLLRIRTVRTLGARRRLRHERFCKEALFKITIPKFQRDPRTYVWDTVSAAAAAAASLPSWPHSWAWSKPAGNPRR